MLYEISFLYTYYNNRELQATALCACLSADQFSNTNMERYYPVASRGYNL